MRQPRSFSFGTVFFAAMGGFLLGVVLMPERFAARSEASLTPQVAQPAERPALRVASGRSYYKPRQGSFELQYVAFADERPMVVSRSTQEKRSSWTSEALLTDLQRSYKKNIGALFGTSSAAPGFDDPALYFGKASGKKARYGFSKPESSFLPESLSWIAKLLPL